MSNFTKDGVGSVQVGRLPELNARLLEEVVAWAVWNQNLRATVEAVPKLTQYLKNIPTWGQNSWSSAQGGTTVAQADEHVCKTSYCIAGYGAYVSGYVARQTLTDPEEIARSYGYSNVAEAELEDEVLPEKLTLDRIVNLDQLVPNAEDYDPDDGAWSAAGKALFGLTEEEADQLFDGDNSIETVQALAQDITKSRGLEPLRFDAWTFTKAPNDELWAYFDDTKYAEVAG